MCTDMSHDSGSQCMRMEDIQLTSKNTICIEYRSTQTQIQQDHSAECGVLIGADKVLKEECNASDLTLACQSYLRHQLIMYSDKSHNQNWSKSNHVLKWTPCDGSRHASCINWLTYDVEGHLPQNTSMSHTPTNKQTPRSLHNSGANMQSNTSIHTFIQADKCAHAQTGMNIYCEPKESSHHHGKCTGCMQTHTSAAKFKPKIQRHTVASNSRAHMCKIKPAMTNATCSVHHKDLQPKSTSI